MVQIHILKCKFDQNEILMVLQSISHFRGCTFYFLWRQVQSSLTPCTKSFQGRLQMTAETSSLTSKDEFSSTNNQFNVYVTR